MENHEKVYSKQFVIRVSDETAASVVTRAERAGLTRSQYVRLLLMLPVDVVSDAAVMDSDVAGEEETAAFRPSESIVDGVADTEKAFRDAGLDAVLNTDKGPFVLATKDGCTRIAYLTEFEISNLRVAINRWGVNYNQAVHALNLIVKKYVADDSPLDGGEKREIKQLLRIAAYSNEEVGEGIKEIDSAVQKLAYKPMLRAYGLPEPKRKRPRSVLKGGL